MVGDFITVLRMGHNIKCVHVHGWSSLESSKNVNTSRPMVSQSIIALWIEGDHDIKDLPTKAQ